MSKPYQCKNCEEFFDEEFDYCPHCGQEKADNLTFGVLFSNTIANYFSIDARFFKSFIPLLTKPGVLARRFVDGKRLTYLHPAQFYLFISVLFFFIFSFSVRRADNQVSKALKNSFEKANVLDAETIKKDTVVLKQIKEELDKNPVLEKLPEKDKKVIDSVLALKDSIPDTNISFSFKRKVLDSLIEARAPVEEQLKAMGMDENESGFVKRFYEQVLKFYKQKGGGILKTIFDTVPIAMFFMLPLFAFILKILYWRRATFAHHMVFSFYFFTFIFTAFSIFILADNYLSIPVWLKTLFFLSFIIYLMLALRNFYKSSWFGAFFKANFISFVYMLIVLPIAAVGLILVSFMLY